MGLFSDFDNKKSIKKLQKIANKILLLNDKYESMSDEELKNQTQILKERLKKGESLDDILPDAFAVVREAGKRVLKMKHFNVQILGGIVLHQGRIAEMKTGEGKTLVATLPAYLNALSGEPVHIVTVNEYLAKRDSEWMGKIHQFLGLSVGYIYSGQGFIEKKKAYQADITYGTNSEFGFDYLRDNMQKSKDNMVGRGQVFAIIDEVDSILIDEARTPLIISGASGQSNDSYKIANNFVKSLRAEDYSIDEKEKAVTLTESGIEKAERWYGVENLSDSIEINHAIDNALKAWHLRKKDSDYIVRNGEILIVDEFTGRILVGRRYSDGLHQAIEAKENVKINGENRTLATITLQNLFKQYKKVSGMTGTAKTEEGEFKEIYGLDVVTIPTNKPMIRIDENDAFYFSHKAKLDAIIEDIVDTHSKEQPVLVGTITVEKSEELSKLLKRKKIVHNVLNAKNHLREAEIIAQAGKKGAVTIATNMAGRGTDIMLGGNAEFMAKKELENMGIEHDDIELATSYQSLSDPRVLEIREKYQQSLEKYKNEVAKEKAEVVELGGLRIIGTERHESRRIDNQLRGRSGRQGDPGSSIFYLSADDDLARVFGSERLKKLASTFNLDQNVNIRWKFFTRSVETAQRRVENRNYSIRKSLVEYDNVINRMREEVYKERNRVLDGEDMHDKIMQMAREAAFEMIDPAFDAEEWDAEEINKFVEKCGVLEDNSNFVSIELLEKYSQKQLKELIVDEAIDQLEKRIEFWKNQNIEFGKIENDILLTILDRKWIEHIDNMDALRQGIGLRGLGQQNPIVAYKKEGFDMFDDMINSLRFDVGRQLLTIRGIKVSSATKFRIEAGKSNSPIQKKKAIGRNDDCPCGSGKKYKNCCGKNL